MTVYLYSEWEGRSYTTTNYFYATSLEEAEKLLNELYVKTYDIVKKVNFLEEKSFSAYAKERDAYDKEYKELRENLTVEDMPRIREMQNEGRPKNDMEKYLSEEEVKVVRNFYYDMLGSYTEALPYKYADMTQQEFVAYAMDRLIKVELDKLVFLSQQDGD